MAFGQIDPARLDGDALRRWYMRSPADIEQERQQAADQRYQDFFGEDNADLGSGLRTGYQTDGQISNSGVGSNFDPGFTWVSAGANRLRSVRTSVAPEQPAENSGSADQLSAGASSADRGTYQLAAVSPRLWDYISPGGCANCHGYTPGTLPPYPGHSPFPPGYSPRVGGSGQPGSEPRRDKYPQCEMQERQDRGICAQQPTEPAKAECNKSATERRVWCEEHQGEIGSPDLFTARRRDGRRWP